MRLKKYTSFKINEELELHTELTELLNMLKDRKNKVATYILSLADDRTELIKFPNDYINFGKDLNELSFIASNRIDPDDYPKNFADTRRQSIRTGRLIRKLIADVPKDINRISYTGEFYIMEDEVIIPDGNLPKNYDKIIDFISSMNGNIVIKGEGTGRFKEKESKKNKNVPFYQQQTEKKFKAKNLKTEVKVDKTYELGWYRSSIDKDTGDTYGFLPKGEYLSMSVTDDEPSTKITDVDGNELPITILDGSIVISTNITITDADIEKFVNEFLAIRKALNFDSSGLEFKIVSGEDIRKYYSYKSYLGYEMGIKKGQLWQSCMRHNHCQKYFDIYVDNPEEVKMLVLVTPEDKLVGRALLWKLDDEDEDHDLVTGLFLDRVYAINDADERLFINHAIKNGWVYRDKDAKICQNDETLDDPILKVTLENAPDEWFPYVDTLSHYDIDDEYLTNSNDLHYDHDLSSTQGAWANADESEIDPDYNTDDIDA